MQDASPFCPTATLEAVTAARPVSGHWAGQKLQSPQLMPDNTPGAFTLAWDAAFGLLPSFLKGHMYRNTL